jgi:hypothetical protein
MEAEAVFVGGGCLFLLGVAGDEGGVEVQDQAGRVTPARTGDRYPAPGLGGLQPGGLPGSGAAVRSAASVVVSMSASRRQAVGVEATGPNSSR